MQKFYVYEWYIKDTNEIFYVGKGCGDRYKVTKRNDLFSEKLKNYECDSRIIKYFDSEEEAYNYESCRIAELRAQGQCSCNIQDGGFGGLAGIWTNEFRVKNSEQNVMKADNQRKRMSENNPMKNPEIAKQVNSKKRKPVIIDGIEYESIAQAAQSLHVSTSTITSWCTTGRNPLGQLCYYKDHPITQQQIYNLKNTGKSKKVFYQGETYSSATQAAGVYGVSQTTISRWCRQGRDSKGNPCRYIEDEREIPITIELRSNPFSINGKHYNSKEEASKDLGISVHTITSYLDGKLVSEKYICKYDNQQPSQGNVENSTLEGSETNG